MLYSPAQLSALNLVPDEDHYRGREKPESSNTSHDSILRGGPTTKDLEEPHEHAKNSSQEENYDEDVQKSLFHESLLFNGYVTTPANHWPGLRTSLQAQSALLSDSNERKDSWAYSIKL